MKQSLRQPAAVRQLRAIDDPAAELARRVAALRHRELADRERLLLHAYHHFEGLHGAPIGQRGVCWPADSEVAEFLGRSAITARRGRGRLSNPGKGIAPFIAVRYVPPFHRLPNGETTPHGANVVTLLEMTDQRPSSAELQDANAEVLALEHQLAEARSRVNALAGQVTPEPAAPSKGPRGRKRAPSLHNVSWRSTPARSLLRLVPKFVAEVTGGEGRGCILS